MLFKREALKKYMIGKDRILKDLCGISLYWGTDYKDVDGWSDSDIDMVCEELYDTLFIVDVAMSTTTDNALCPQCIKNFSFQTNQLDCGKCEYGKRHMPCGMRDSTYALIQKNTGGVSYAISTEKMEEFLHVANEFLGAFDGPATTI